MPLAMCCSPNAAVSMSDAAGDVVENGRAGARIGRVRAGMMLRAAVEELRGIMAVGLIRLYYNGSSTVESGCYLVVAACRGLTQQIAPSSSLISERDAVHAELNHKRGGDSQRLLKPKGRKN